MNLKKPLLIDNINGHVVEFPLLFLSEEKEFLSKIFEKESLLGTDSFV